MSDLMAKKSTPASHFCVHSRRMCSQHQLFLISPTTAESHLEQLSLFYIDLSSSLPTKAVLRCGLSDPALSNSVGAFHAPIWNAPIFKGITLVIFCRFQSLRASGFDTGNYLGHLFKPLLHATGVSSAILKRSAQSLSRLPNFAYCYSYGKRQYRTEPPVCRSATTATSVSNTYCFANRPSPHDFCACVGECVMIKLCMIVRAC